MGAEQNLIILENLEERPVHNFTFPQLSQSLIARDFQTFKWVIKKKMTGAYLGLSSFHVWGLLAFNLTVADWSGLNVIWLEAPHFKIIDFDLVSVLFLYAVFAVFLYWILSV